MSIRTLAASALIATTTAGANAAAQVERPFMGSQSSEYMIVGMEGDNIDVEVTGIGHFTHWGLTTYETELTMNLITGAGTGTSVYTAANGDQVFHEFTVQALSDVDRYYEVTAVGGTGRFEGISGFATGFGTVTPTSDFAGVAESSYEGTYTY